MDGVLNGLPGRSDGLEVLLHLTGALVAGGMIGLERSYHGRPAGFRTHTLVCLSSSLLMLVTIYQGRWFADAAGAVRIDPTRMAQGVMTGIGFLGAGVIMKEGLSVRGLTTAASIWTTAAIGVLVGVGLYGSAAIGTALTMGTLTLFGRIEARMPRLLYAHHVVRFRRDAALCEKELRATIREQGFSVANLGYALVAKGELLEYRMVLRARDPAASARLAQALSGLACVVEFDIAPTGD